MERKMEGCGGDENWAGYLDRAGGKKHLAVRCGEFVCVDGEWEQRQVVRDEEVKFCCSWVWVGAGPVGENPIYTGL